MKHFFFSRVGLERSGLFGMCSLVGCTILAAASVYAPGSPMFVVSVVGTTDPDWVADNKTSVVLLLCGIISARFGEENRSSIQIILFLYKC